MQPRAKLALASLMLLAGLCAGLIFRKPAPTEEKFEAPEQVASPGMVLREAFIPAAEPAPVVGHLLGRIDLDEPEAVATAGAAGSPAETLPAPRAGAAPARPSALTLNAPALFSTEPVKSTGGLPTPLHTAPFTKMESEDIGPGSMIYRVQDGDTLSSVARRFLGSADRYNDVFNANQDVLSDPDLLPVGTELKIPLRGTPHAMTESSGTAEPKPMVPIRGGEWRRASRSTEK
jgi:nucleoid-associated protein YgaU